MKDKKQRGESKIEIALEYGNSIIAALREPFLVLDKNLRIISANQSFYNTFKTAKKDTLGRSLPDLGSRQWDIPKLLILLGKILPEKRVMENYEIEYEFKDIGRRCMNLNARQLSVPKKMAGMTAAGVIEEELIMLTIEDITEHKCLQGELKESKERYRRAFESVRDKLLQAKEEQYRALIENLPGKVFLKDRSSVYISCNESYAKDLKIKPEEIAGKTDHDFFPAYLAEKYREDDRRVMDSGRTENIEEEYMMLKDFLRGAQKSVINTVKVPVRDKGGNVTGLFGLFWDITGRKRAEETQNRLFKLINITSDFVGFADGETKNILYINPAGRRMIGVGDREDITRLKIFDVHPEWTNKLFRDEIIPAAARDGTWSGECAFLHRDGREIPVTMVLTAHKSPNNEIEQFSTISRDITERKIMEVDRERTLKWQQETNILRQSLLAPAPLENKLKTITDGIVRIFDADFCRIWLIQPGDLCGKGCIHAEVKEGAHVCRFRAKCLHLVTSSGRYTHIDGRGHARVPFGCYKIGLVASGEEHKFLTNDVVNGHRVHNREWARELGLVSFAGYQLRIPGGETIGVLALFAKHPILLTEDAMLDSLSTTAAFVVQQDTVRR
ncbi:MAG: PAS domain-containing protein [Candidatus Omnitrophota bacterium]|nr:PAS domain-containing protein [Candidatus Omnitrophota bacterium]